MSRLFSGGWHDSSLDLSALDGAPVPQPEPQPRAKTKPTMPIATLGSDGIEPHRKPGDLPQEDE